MGQVDRQAHKPDQKVLTRSHGEVPWKHSPSMSIELLVLQALCWVSGIEEGEKVDEKSLPALWTLQPLMPGFPQRNGFGASAWAPEDFLEEMLPQLSLKGSGSPGAGMKVGEAGMEGAGLGMEEGRSGGGMGIVMAVGWGRGGTEWSRR